MIVLRKLVAEDATPMIKWLNDPLVTMNLSFSNKHFTIEDARSFISKAQEDKENRHFAISDDTNQYFGTISLKNISEQNRHAEYAIVILAEHQGKGYAKQASKLLIEYADQELILNKIYLTVLPQNLKAIDLYEKLGFVKQGVYQQHLHINHEYKDLLYYELLLGEKNDI